MTVKNSKVDTRKQTRVKNINQAIEIVQDLQLFFEQEGLQQVLPLTYALEDALEEEWYKRRRAASQTKISNFFEPVSK